MSATPEKLTPTKLGDLRKSREKTVVSPAGNVYKIRPLNLERHALSGGLPPKLRAVALQGAEGLNAIFDPENEDSLNENGEAVKGYLDRLVADVIVEPSLKGEDGEVDEDAIDLIPPVDFKWALAIAMGEEDRDGEGRRLWGREPLSRWETFRHFHGCDEDCDGCSRVLAAFSASS